MYNTHPYFGLHFEKKKQQAGGYISPGHHIAETELQILARFSLNFVANQFNALFIDCSSEEDG